MRWTWVMALAAACGPTAQFNVKCQRIASELCTHQLQCDQIIDYPDCVANLRDTSYCDPDRTLTDLDVCITDIGVADCSIGYPDSCNAVLCDEQTGCGATFEHTGTTNTRSL